MGRWVVVVVSLCALVACGAKTGLGVRPRDRPDGGSDSGIDGGSDAGVDTGPVCGPTIALLPAHADVLLVLDRSGSMTRALASSPTSRWQALRGALAAGLPAFDRDVAFGATIFPVPEATIEGGTVCNVGAVLDVPVGLGTGPSILAALDAHPPSGGTPTADALAVATSALAARARIGVPQAIVLATDGGPNCDPADRAQPWFGQAPETCAETGVDPNECLDRTRTLSRIDAALAMGIPTYVIAMDVSEDFLVAVLRQMAVAGGRARMGGSEPYYDVRNPDDLGAAFADIATRVSSCSFFPDGMATLDGSRVEVDGTVIERDESRMNGWALGASGTFDLFGDACERAMSAGASVVLVGACH